MTVLAGLAAKKRLRVAGLMSGTSADGVDVAIVDIGPRGVKLLAFDTVSYLPSLRRDVLRMCRATEATVYDLCHFNFAMGVVFASALRRVVRKSRIGLDTIDLVGSHGQTVCHIPAGRPFGRRRLRSTLQIAEPSVIAERTGITTVADFRPADVAAGGQGAPLVPYADYVLFRDEKKSRAVQNIGGIANVTYLPARCTLDDIIAFDTGPGNMLIDSLVHAVTGGKSRYDAEGALAAGGSVSRSFLNNLMREAFLRKAPPKSTGREEFGGPFAEALHRTARKEGLRGRDIVATVTAFTARSIADAYRRFLPQSIDEVILCGGGAHTRTLVKMLGEELAAQSPGSVPAFRLSDEFGISVDAKEAVAFAILARETLRGAAGNVPSATGAKHPVILGKIIPV